MLQLELRDLSSLGADLSGLGFTEQELARALQSGGIGLTDENDTPEVTETTVSKACDVWRLGKHRVVCGDSTDANAVAAAVGEQKPSLMVTDPPYGVEYDPTWRERYDKFKRHARGKVENDDRADWAPAWRLFKGSVAYVWHGGLHSATVQASLEAAGFEMRAQIVWAKQHFVFGRGHYHWQHEPCWYAVRSKGEWSGDRKQTTLWSIPNHNPMGGKSDDESTGHGTQKPVECMRRPMLNNSKVGDAIYEPFLGSGTTLIAAESVGRVCLAIEIDPGYVDVAIRRWQAFTGQPATLDADGRTFDDVAAARLKQTAAAKPVGAGSPRRATRKRPRMA
jgi:DNA modification methylase